MVEVVVFLAFVIVAPGVYFGISSLQARRRRAALAKGEDAAFRVRLSGGRSPYPKSVRRGRLTIEPTRMVWEAMFGGLALDLTDTGIRPIGIATARFREQAGDYDTVVTAADGMGVPLRMIGGDVTMEQLQEVLRERGMPESPVPVRLLAELKTHWWHRPSRVIAAVLVALGLLGGLFTTWTWVAGVEVMATITSEEGDDGYCQVRWLDPRDGQRKYNNVDCYWDVGDEAPFVALADPLRGEIVDRDDPYFWAVISGLLVVGAGGFPAFSWWRSRREPASSDWEQAPPGPPPATPPILTRHQLTYDEVAAALRLHAAADGWYFDPEPGDKPSGRTTRKVLTGALVSISWPLVAGALFGGLTGWTSFGGLWASAGPTATVTAQVLDAPEAFLPLGPKDLPVKFPLRGGGEADTLVAVVGLPDDRPESIRIEYDLDNPDRARALEYDGVPRGSLMSGGIILIGLGLSGFNTWRVVATLRGERRARSGPIRHVRYVLLPGVDDDSYLLLYDGGGMQGPTHLLELVEDQRGQILGAGSVEVRGRYQTDEIVVPIVAGVELATASRLLEIDTDEVLALVNGVTVEES